MILYSDNESHQLLIGFIMTNTIFFSFFHQQVKSPCKHYYKKYQKLINSGVTCGMYTDGSFV